MTVWSGLLLFDKPQGWTSHDVVAVVRRMLARDTKVGHCGTLDPLATGLLMILVGPATREQERLQGLDKVYSGTIRLGVATETGDVMGKELQRKPVPALTLTDLQRRLDALHGRLEMPAPAYSAVKHQGRPLYKYARAGVAVPVKPRVSTVHEWRALSYEEPELSHRLSCSSGTYVRSLAELLGAALGCGATVSALRRESAGAYVVDGALTLEQFKALSLDHLRARLLPVSR